MTYSRSRTDVALRYRKGLGKLKFMIFSLDIMFKKTLAIAKKSAPPAVGEEAGAAGGVEKAELSDAELDELEEFRRRKERKRETDKLNKQA